MLLISLSGNTGFVLLPREPSSPGDSSPTNFTKPPMGNEFIDHNISAIIKLSGPADLSLPTMIESSLVMVLKSEVRTSRTDLTNLRSSKKPISKVNTLPHNLPTSISSIILEEVFISVLPVQKPIIFGGNPNPNSRTLTLNSLAVKK